MAFVNERISKGDIEKYGLEEIDRGLIYRSPARDWTIDREKNIFLRMLDAGMRPDGPTGRSIWHLYWGGEFTVVELQTLKTEGDPGGSRHGYKKIVQIDIPVSIENKREAIMRDLFDALVAYKDGGVFATAQEYELTLEQ